MATLLPSTVEASPLRKRAIPLTSEQLVELDDMISAAARDPIEPTCAFDMMMCIQAAVGVQVGGTLNASDSDADYVEIVGDSVRLIRPSLEQLLEARRRAVLKS